MNLLSLVLLCVKHGRVREGSMDEKITGVPVGRFPHPLNIEKNFQDLKMRVGKSALMRAKQAGLDKRQTGEWLWSALLKCWQRAMSAVQSRLDSPGEWLNAKLLKIWGPDFEQGKLHKTSHPLFRLREAYDDKALFDETTTAAEIMAEMPTLSTDPASKTLCGSAQASAGSWPCLLRAVGAMQ